MKKGAKVTFLVMALLWFVLQMCNFINQIVINLNLIYPNGMIAHSQFIIDLCIENITTLFFAATIITVFIADLAQKKLKHEKILCGISAVLFFAYTVISSINQYNSFINNPQDNAVAGLNRFSPYIMNLFALLIFVFITVYLIFIMFNIRFRKAILALYCISVLLYMTLEFIQLLTPTDQYVINPFNVIAVIFAVSIVFLAIFGFMLRDVKNTSKTTEPVLDKPLVSQ
ncbi:MAG: hypothetical protein Q8903_14790 [Bacteroidota bacterium]|nr:hypothetical protein [Bacteroidota bacterium]